MKKNCNTSNERCEKTDGYYMAKAFENVFEDNEYDEVNTIEKGCWWYLPVSFGLIVLAFALGFISGVRLID